MNEEEKFLTIEALSSLIDEKVKSIQNGGMKIEKLELLLDEVKELQERLIIIKYKAIEKLADSSVDKIHSNVEEKNVSEKTDERSELNFSLDKKWDVPENQISLIDSIEEIIVEKSITVAKPIGLFEGIEDVVPEKKVEVNTSQKKERKTLSQKINNTSIKSIPKAIKLNARIGMIKQLFGGDEKKFKSEIEKLNSANNLEDANQLLNSLKEEGNWDEENERYILLTQLVERRYPVT